MGHGARIWIPQTAVGTRRPGNLTGRACEISIIPGLAVPKHFSSLWLCFGLRLLTDLPTDISAVSHDMVGILAVRRQRGR
jgi:hypothetical protein